MNCHDARTAILAGESSSAVRAHVEGCADCQRWESTTVSIHATLNSESLWSEPPAELEDSIVAAIKGVGSRPTIESTSTVSRVPSWKSRRSTVLVGSIAAVAILLVGLFAVRSAPEPDWSVALVGTENAPAATATVVGFNSAAGGTRVVFEAPDLGAAPEGFIYQLWFSKKSGDVSAGTFADASHVELSIGVRRSEFPAVWLGLQPIGTDSAADAEVLLVPEAD